jgi:hypothetical protein
MRNPIWVSGRVPNGYWSTRTNRLKYLHWLGKRLRYRRIEDWYDLTRRRLIDNYGGGLLATVYRHSPLRALQDLRPKYAWKPWLMASTPQGYWLKHSNRQAYMRWLGEQIGIRRNADWYKLTQEHFHRHQGGGLLGVHYRNSPIDAVRDFKPNVDWKPWLFVAVPQGFWQKRDNRRAYMAWLGKKLGYRKPEDWYRVTRRDFYNHGGGALLHTIPGHSPLAALREYLPDHDWLEWRFSRVPNGFWTRRANRVRFLDALADHHNLRRPADWYRLTRDDIRAFGGSALLMMRYNNSLLRLLKDRFPRQRWDPVRLYGPVQGARLHRLAA